MTEPSSTETAARGRTRTSVEETVRFCASGRRSAQRRDCWAGARVSRDIPRAKSGPLSVTCGVDLVRRHHRTTTARSATGDTLGLFRQFPPTARTFSRGSLGAADSITISIFSWDRGGPVVSSAVTGLLPANGAVTDTHMPLRTTEVLNNSRPRSTARRRDIKRSEARGGKHLRCKRGSLCVSQGPQQ